MQSYFLEEKKHCLLAFTGIWRDFGSHAQSYILIEKFLCPILRAVSLSLIFNILGLNG